MPAILLVHLPSTEIRPGHLASLAEQDLHTQPDCTHEPGRDDGHNRLEGVALCLLNALAPSSQMLKVGAHLPSILLLNAERSQCCRDRTLHDGIDIIAMKPLLFSEGLQHDRLDIIILQSVH